MRNLRTACVGISDVNTDPAEDLTLAAIASTVLARQAIENPAKGAVGWVAGRSVRPMAATERHCFAARSLS